MSIDSLHCHHCLEVIGNCLVCANVFLLNKLVLGIYISREGNIEDQMTMFEIDCYIELLAVTFSCCQTIYFVQSTQSMRLGKI